MTCLEKFRAPAYGFLQSVSTGLIVVSIISMCFQDVEPVLTRNMTIVPFWKLAASNAVRPIDTRGPVEAPKRPDSNNCWMDGQPVPTQSCHYAKNCQLHWIQQKPWTKTLHCFNYKNEEGTTGRTTNSNTKTKLAEQGSSVSVHLPTLDGIATGACQRVRS